MMIDFACWWPAAKNAKAVKSALICNETVRAVQGHHFD